MQITLVREMYKYMWRQSVNQSNAWWYVLWAWLSEDCTEYAINACGNNADYANKLDQVGVSNITRRVETRMRNLTPTVCVALPSTSALASAECACVDSEVGNMWIAVRGSIHTVGQNKQVHGIRWYDFVHVYARTWPKCECTYTNKSIHICKFIYL